MSSSTRPNEWGKAWVQEETERTEGEVPWSPPFPLRPPVQNAELCRRPSPFGTGPGDLAPFGSAQAFNKLRE
jgi:hypothetical protein